MQIPSYFYIDMKLLPSKCLNYWSFLLLKRKLFSIFKVML